MGWRPDFWQTIRHKKLDISAVDTVDEALTAAFEAGADAMREAMREKNNSQASALMQELKDGTLKITLHRGDDGEYIVRVNGELYNNCNRCNKQ